MRLLLLPAVLLALPLHAQETLTVGDSVSGALGSEDPVLADGSHYRLYRLPLATAQRVRVVLLSADFDAFLAVEHSDMPNGACATDDCQTDDDSGGGTDAMVDFVALRDGMHTIRVNSLNGGEAGSYTLLIEPGIAPPDGVRGEMVVDAPVAGELDPGDPAASDDSYYEEWTFRPLQDGRVRITLRSSDFDAYLGFGTRTGDAFAALDSNDDGPDGTNAELEVWVEGGTLYTIRANTFEAGESGRYTLTVTNISGR